MYVHFFYVSISERLGILITCSLSPFLNTYGHRLACIMFNPRKDSKYELMSHQRVKRELGFAPLYRPFLLWTAKMVSGNLVAAPLFNTVVIS